MAKDYKYEIGQKIKDEKRDITIIGISEIKRKNSDRKEKCYKIQCNICGFNGGKHYSIRDKQYKDEYWIREHNLKKYKCSCCASNIVVENINSIYKTDPWMIPYIREDCAKTHTHCSEDYIFPICSDCGKIKDKSMMIRAIYNNHSVGCICGRGNSYSNKFAFNLLKQLDVEFETEYSPKWIKPKRYDFYFKLQDKEYILEMDGGLGHGKRDNKMNGQTKEESQAIDDYKNEMAKQHGIEVIRIDCDYNYNRFEFIKNNILQNRKLNELFNLNRIDWNKVEEFALSNLVKVACEYKKNNPELTTTEIAKIMNIHRKTARRWLIQGTEVGWCYYNAEEEVKKKNNIIYTRMRKMVVVFKNGISQRVFESTIEIERQSLELFGFLIKRVRISEVCLGKRKSYKGLTFKYVSNLTQEEYIKYEVENKLKELELSNNDSSFFI